MARPGQGFPTLRDEVRGELRNVMVNAPATALATALATSDDEDDDDDRDLPIASAPWVPPRTIPRALFGRAEDEITTISRSPAPRTAPSLAAHRARSGSIRRTRRSRRGGH